MLRPKIKEYLDIFPMERDVYQVRGAEFLSVLRAKSIGQLFEHLLPLLNGEYTIEQIVEKLDGIAPPDTIRSIIKKLLVSTILEDADENSGHGLPAEQAGGYRNQIMFFEITSQQKSAAECQKALQESKVSVIGGGELASKVALECAQAGVGTIVDVNLTVTALKGNGQKPTTSEPEDMDAIERLLATDPPSLIAIALDRPEPESLERVNQLSQDYKIPLIHSRIYGTEGIVGPLVIPGKTACLKCHHLRMMRNYDFYDEYVAWEKWIKNEGRQKRSATPSTGSFTSVIAGMTALEIIKQVSGFHEPELYGRFLTVNSLSFEVMPHPVLKIPRCPSCGNARGKVGHTPWLEKR